MKSVAVLLLNFAMLTIWCCEEEPEISYPSISNTLEWERECRRSGHWYLLD